MSIQHRWVFGLAAGAGALSIAATSSIILLAQHFVEELSRPHGLIDAGNITWTLPGPEPEPPVSQRRSILFHTADGILLSGDFWAQSQPAPTIIICHGYRINRTVLRPVAALEYKHGYNVLLFDFRGHGESESIATSGGNAEIRDLEAAIVVARQQAETNPGKIVIHGFSMAASVALLLEPQTDIAIPIAHAYKIETQAQTHNIAMNTYFVDEADHCGAYGYNPQQYIQVLEQFITQNLG